MADVAQLGIQVSSNGVDKATSGLTELSGAAARAQAMTDGLATSNRGASGAASAAAKAYADEGSAAASSSKQIDLMRKAANQNSAALTATVAPSKTLAYQSRLVALQLSQVAQQTMATGNFIQALAIQLPDLALGFGAVGIAIGVLLGIALPLLDLPKRIASGLRLLADNLQVIAPYAVAAAAGLALLYSPQIIGGIVSLIAYTARLAVQLGILAGAFLLANPVALFIVSLTAAVAAATVFREELAKVFGTDIVDAAKTGANLIIGSFVAAYDDLKLTWANFPNIIGAAAIGAANLAVKGINLMIDTAKAGINTLIEQINKIPGVNIGTLTTGKGTVPEIPNPYAALVDKYTDDRSKAISSDLSADYLGNFGGAINRGASAATGKLKELAGWLDKVGEKTKKSKGGKGSNEEDPYDQVIDSAERKLATLQADRDAVGLSAAAAAKLRYETELLNEAQAKGITLTDAQRTQLIGLADKMAGLESSTKQAKQALDDAKSATNGFLSDLRSGLQNGEGFFQSFGKAALNVLNKVIDKVQNELVDALFSIGGANSGGTSIFGSILGGIGKLFGFASGGYTGGGAANQVAGVVHAGEFVFSKKATDRIGVGNLSAMHGAAKGYAAGGPVTPGPTRVAANTNGGSITVRTVNEVQNGNLVPVMTEISGNVAGQQIRQAAPALINTSVKQSGKNVMPTVAAYQSGKAGRDYRLV